MAEVDLSTVLAALIGAVFGAAANGWVRGQETKRMQKRECKGLLRLINNEVAYNTALLQSFLDKFSDDYEVDVAVKVSDLRTETWDKVMDRLAQLLEREDLISLSSYYGNIRLFQLGHASSIEAETLSPETKERIEDLIAQPPDIYKIINKY